jgi:membrane-associated phospholipid phosphatase
VSDGALIAIAIVCVIVTALVGMLVARRRPGALDVQALRLRGHGTPMAVLFTRSGYWPALVVICVLEFIIAFALHMTPFFVIILGAAQLLSQAAVDGIKALYRRLRPDDWLFHQELGFSFPSGHATTAVVFFGGLLLFVWNAPFEHVVHIAASIAIAIWIAGIPWSRMVLAAHYGTDVLGGILFGAAWLCVAAVVLAHVPALLSGTRPG